MRNGKGAGCQAGKAEGGAFVMGRDFLSLTRFIPSALSSLSAVTGFMAARCGPPGLLPPLALGTLLLAMGASVLNQIQERRWDARMERTRDRPLPRGTVGLGVAGWLAALLSLGGAALLARGCGWVPAFLGLGALGWYLLLYTPLKHFTAFAVLPGALAGIALPAMGWCAAGGDLDDPLLGALGLVFYLWQVPHFCLLALLQRERFDAPAFPTLARHFSSTTIRWLTFAWSCAAAAASLLLIALDAVTMPLSQALLLAAALIWVGRSAHRLRKPAGTLGYRRAFADINLFILAVMAAVILG